jgi:hypothetical protein
MPHIRFSIQAAMCDWFQFPSSFQLRSSPKELNAARSIAFRVLFKASQASDVGPVSANRRSERVVDRKPTASTAGRFEVVLLPSRPLRVEATGVKVHFCDPQSPWQRGSNENTTGLLRQYFPKKTDLSDYTQSDLDKVALRLNQPSRKTLGFQTSASKLRASVASTYRDHPPYRTSSISSTSGSAYRDDVRTSPLYGRFALDQ